MARAYGVGIVGAGAIFDAHVAALRSLGGRLVPVAFAEPDPSRRAEAGRRHFIPHATDDHRRLLEREDVDIVAVLTPPASHARIAAEALDAGKLVVCEKPLATSLVQLDELAALDRAHPGRLSTVYQRRYFPEIARLLHVQQEGRLGRLVGGHFARWASGDRLRRSPTWGRWADAGGGPVMASFVHELDTIARVYGAPVGVSASMDTVHTGIETEDTFGATLRFASGALVTCSGAVGVGTSRVAFEVVGTRGVFRFSSEDGRQGAERSGRWWRVARRVSGRLIRRAPERGRDPGATHRPYFEDLLAALDAGRPLPIGFDEARRATEIAVAIYASALSGRSVTLPVDPSSPAHRGMTAGDYRSRAGGRDATAPCARGGSP